MAAAVREHIFRCFVLGLIILVIMHFWMNFVHWGREQPSYLADTCLELFCEAYDSILNIYIYHLLSILLYCECWKYCVVCVCVGLNLSHVKQEPTKRLISHWSNCSVVFCINAFNIHDLGLQFMETMCKWVSVKGLIMGMWNDLAYANSVV